MLNPRDDRSAEALKAAAQAGQAVQSLKEQPGWDALVAGVAVKRDMVLAGLVHGKPTSEPAKYADKIGEVRGLERFTEVADEIVADGEIAAGQLEYLEVTA